MSLGSPHHPEYVFEHLNDSTFAERFGDIRLIFEGGEVVDYYRALLSLLSWEWSQLLQEAHFSDTVLLPDMSVRPLDAATLTDELSQAYILKSPRDGATAFLCRTLSRGVTFENGCQSVENLAHTHTHVYRYMYVGR